MTSGETPERAATTARPNDVVWDITYACPLRCVHCYSESGRRPSRQPGRENLLRITDALVSLRPSAVVLAGGEPLIVPALPEIVRRFVAAGVEVLLYTGGWTLPHSAIDTVLSLCSATSVSLDAPDAAVHDRIRGRAGSFDRAMESLGRLDAAARDRDERGEPPLVFGIDATLVRSSIDRVERFCTEVAPRFPRLAFLSLGVAMPIGLASRDGFVEHELPGDEQADRLVDPGFLAHLRELAPPGLQVSATDNRLLRYHPDLIAAGRIPAMQVEPDGRVRAMAIYEGTVGDLLTDPPLVLWQRSVERWSDPFVVRTLSPVRTMRQWAAATRSLDRHFAAAEDRERIDRRPTFLPLAVPAAG